MSSSCQKAKLVVMLVSVVMPVVPVRQGSPKETPKAKDSDMYIYRNIHIGNSPCSYMVYTWALKGLRHHHDFGVSVYAIRIHRASGCDMDIRRKLES